MLARQLATLARHAATYGSADVFGTLVNFLLLPIITRHLDPTDYGALGILLLFGVVAKIVFRMGLDAGFFRIYYEQTSEEDRRRFTTSVLVAAAAVSGTLFVLTVLAARPLARALLGESFARFVVLVAADTLLASFAFVPMNLFRIHGRAGYFTAASVLRNALNAALKVGLVVAGWGIAGVLWADVVASAVFVLALAPSLAGRLGGGVSAAMLREALAFGLPKVPHGIAYQILNLSDRKLLDLFATRVDAGLYHVGYMFGTGVKFFLSAFELAWSPFVYSLVRRADAPRSLARIATYAAVALVAVGLAIAVFARELLRLMTAPEFHAAWPVVPVVVLAHLLQGLFILTGIGIGISKRAYYYPLLTVSAAVVNVGLNLVLIPTYGKMGAAWSTVAGYAVMSGLGIVVSRRHYPIPFEWDRIAKAALAGAACYAASLAAPPAGWSGLAAKALVLAAYPVALFALGFFRAEELRRLKAVGLAR